MMQVSVWGARGSIATPGPETNKYGGNTSCLSVLDNGSTFLVLDAGTGLRRLSQFVPKGRSRVDVLLTHLHMDHIQGLGFFGPLYNPNMEVHLWGPDSATLSLEARLNRYLSPPLFPVHLRELPCKLVLHTVPDEVLHLDRLTITPCMLCHPGPTVGYRIEGPEGIVSYIPDHEPSLAGALEQSDSTWISGYDVARGADLLFHDAQYAADEYQGCIGWGHCSMGDAVRFADRVSAKNLVFFHHDPGHSDDELDSLAAPYTSGSHAYKSIYGSALKDVYVASEGSTFLLKQGEVTFQSRL